MCQICLSRIELLLQEARKPEAGSRKPEAGSRKQEDLNLQKTSALTVAVCFLHAKERHDSQCPHGSRIQAILPFKSMATIYSCGVCITKYRVVSYYLCRINKSVS